jgi:hypothetical protein
MKKIVIEIDDELYNEILSRKYSKTRLEKAVANGTLLPEHHGRLIDADALTEKAPEIQEYLDVLAPTIIEADKER